MSEIKMGIVSFSQLLGEICGSILMHFSFPAEVILVDGIRKCHASWILQGACYQIVKVLKIGTIYFQIIGEMI